MLQKSMEQMVRKYSNFDEMKADEYRYWQGHPVHDRIDAVDELIQWLRRRLHSQPRFTKDIFIKPGLANAEATYAALARFGAPLEGIRPDDFADRSSFFRFGHDPYGFDILPSIPGVAFDSAWERRVEGVIDAETAFKAYFISIDDLIAGKLASGRTRDLADVEDIRHPARSYKSSTS